MEAVKAGSCCGYKAMQGLRIIKEEYGKSDVYRG
jgi:hypothetical protein